MADDLFAGKLEYKTRAGETVQAPKRGKHYTTCKGYAGTPGDGPDGETCKTCKHLYRNRMAKVYLKCKLNEKHWTGGRGSDVLAGSPACQFWEKNED